MTKKNSAILNMIIATSLTMAAKLFAILRQMALTYFYGAGSVSDAYLLAQSIPNTVFVLVSTAIASSFIPVFSKVYEKDGERESIRFVSNYMTIVYVLAGLAVALVLCFSKQVIFVFASGFDEKTADLAAQLLRISIFSVFFIGAIGILSSYLKIKNNYFAPHVIAIPLSIIEIVSCVIAYHSSTVILAWGILIANFVQWLILSVAALRNGYRYSPYLDLKSEYIKIAVLTAMPVMIGLGADEINVVVDRTMASMFDSGSISMLTYASTIANIVHTIISVSINSVVFVQVSKYAAENNHDAVIDEIFSGINKLLLLLIPATVGVIAYAKSIIRFLYERGNFTAEDTVVTAGVFVFYALSIVPNGLRIVVQSYYYAYRKTGFCMFAGLIAVAFNILFNILLSKSIGINGLAIATTLGIIISALILFVGFVIKNREFPIKSLMVILLKISVSSLIMIIPSFILYQALIKSVHYIGAMLISIPAGIIIYAVCIVVLKLVKLSEIRGMFCRLLKRG